MKILAAAIIILVASSNLWGFQSTTGTQDQPKSVADVAREYKKSKQKSDAKVVLNDDNFPGREQSQIVTSAPAAANGSPSSSNGSPASSYVAGIPDLFPNDKDNADDVLKAVENIKNQRGAAAAESSLHVWYNKYDAMMDASIRRLNLVKTKPKSEVGMNDALDAMKMARMQVALLKIRLGLVPMGLNPEWFKLRCQDGNYPGSGGCPK